MRRTLTPTIATLLAAVALAGCGGSSTSTTVTVTTGATTTMTVTTSTTTTTTGPVATTIPWPPAGLGTDQTPVLRTPSGNIECVLDAELGAICVAHSHEWTLPPKPVSCEFEWTDGVTLTASGRPHFRCASDIPFGPANRYWPRTALPYGASVIAGGVTCTSHSDGLTCTNADAHGFGLSRQQITFF